ncbi:hypothetical protein [Hymenobacter sp.]|uniref:hypothetical protein n=1 Tax=Hymenobacter sp. TaxID=1898978 RepID=UPI00286CDDA6|nr:hypothetical protein [Hymenobacter sp.]
MSRSTSARRPKRLPVLPLASPFAAALSNLTEALPPGPEPVPPGALRLGDYVIGEGLYANVSGHPGIRY